MLAGHGAIVVQLAQPYYVDSLRLLLWDCDNRAYCYTVEVSVDNNKWTMIKDNSTVPCRSWQVIRFNPRPVVFIRIIGTKNTANEVRGSAAFIITSFNGFDWYYLEILNHRSSSPSINL